MYTLAIKSTVEPKKLKVALHHLKLEWSPIFPNEKYFSFSIYDSQSSTHSPCTTKPNNTWLSATSNQIAIAFCKHQTAQENYLNLFNNNNNNIKKKLQQRWNKTPSSKPLCINYYYRLKCVFCAERMCLFSPPPCKQWVDICRALEQVNIEMSILFLVSPLCVFSISYHMILVCKWIGIYAKCSAYEWDKLIIHAIG